jgi:hypothetical protein
MYKTIGYLFLALLLAGCAKQPPILSLHPDNPHYFLFRGKPTVLVGSTEHYGAVLNSEFNYVKYLDELASTGLNVTRTFSGAYMEPIGAFGIAGNTLAPASEKLICPWARSQEPGYANGGNKFDLEKWDDAYFTRLKDFITEAGKRGIVVELDLFSNYYDTVQWRLSPLYNGNNINGIGDFLDPRDALSLRHPDVLAMQEKMVVKIVEELRGFDNLYYEVCNEPYFGDLVALDEFEQHMTGIIAGAEQQFDQKHLISQNIANGSEKVDNPNPLVSIYNFHYAKPPVTVDLNYGLSKVIGDNETGFNGIADVQYRTEAWDFFAAGGGLYNNLDYSFFTGHEDGSFVVAEGQPGGGGKSLRSQLSLLKHTIDSLPFLTMKPRPDWVIQIPTDSTTVRILSDEAGNSLVYLNSRQQGDSASARVYTISLPAGSYTGYWLNPVTGDRINIDLVLKDDGRAEMKTPVYTEDMVLVVRRGP